MHTVLVMAGGALLLLAFLLLGRLFWGTSPAAFATAAVCFMPSWLILSAANMWFGVRKAGYTFSEELPIFFLVFAVPAVVAAVVWWWFSRSS
jgi:hypothetical protein